jgi:hypothetical protein
VVVGGCGSYIAYMNIALRRPFTVEEYLAWAATQRDLPRTELINGQIVAMTPERVEHIEIKVAAVIALKRAIARAGVPCHAARCWRATLSSLSKCCHQQRRTPTQAPS